MCIGQALRLASALAVARDLVDAAVVASMKHEHNMNLEEYCYISSINLFVEFQFLTPPKS